MKVLVDLKEMANQDVDLFEATMAHAESYRHARESDDLGTVIEVVRPNGPGCTQIQLKDGHTETEFWMEFLIDVLSNDDWMDVFKENGLQ